MTQRPFLCFVPGLLCDRSIWTAQLEAFADTFATAVADLRGLTSIEAMAEHVLAAAPKRFSLAGHSMGARVALEVVRRAPARVERLALLDTGTHAVRPGEREAREALLRIGREQGMDALAEAWLPPMIHDPAGAASALMAELRAMVRSRGLQVYGDHMAALLDRPDAVGHLPRIDCPVLIGVGAYDTWSPPAQHEALATAIPGARLVVFPDSGHMAPAEAPAAVTDALRTWMGEPVRPAASPPPDPLDDNARNAIVIACERLIYRFAQLNDAGDASRIAEAFVPEGSFARPSDPDRPVVGREAIFRFFRDRPKRKTRHAMSNVVVDVDGPDQARATSYVVLYTGAEGSIASIAVGTFDDVIVRRHGAWLFQERRGGIDFTQANT